MYVTYDDLFTFVLMSIVFSLTSQIIKNQCGLSIHTTRKLKTRITLDLYNGVYGIRTRGLHNANVARSQLR